MSGSIAKASRMCHGLRGLACACVLLTTLAAPRALAQQAPVTPSSSTTSTAVFANAELDQMFASIALYPDPLLAQVLMASTYPGDVADAAKWSKAHPDAKGESAVAQVASQPWDPSVQSLVAFPQVLASLGQDSNWVQRMGDAFLAQPEAVMDSVQRLRHQAEQSGNLASNQYQQVSSEPAIYPDTQSTIIIESADPEVIYVPSYDPTVVYAGYGWGGYPPYYYPAPSWYPGAALATGIMWGAGMAMAGALWGNVNWGGGDIDIDIDNNFNSNRNVDRGNRGDRAGDRAGNRAGDRAANRAAARGEGGKWQHNSANRDGTPYRDNANRERHGKQLGGANDRAGFRGDDAQRSQARNQARQSMDRRGLDSPAMSNRQALDRARQANATGRAPGGGGYRQSGRNNSASRDNARRNSSQYQSRSRNNAFSGSRNPGASRSQSQRGNASRSSYRSGGGSRSGASRSVSRGGMRGGGGGRRR
jgi:hypothetical protein